MRKPDVLVFILLVGALVPLEVLCAFLAFHTLGEIVSGFYFLLVALNLNLVFVAIAIFSRTLAAIGAVALGLAIIPYQLVLADRLMRVQAEVTRILTFAYEQRQATGEYPADLRAYTFHDPDTRQYLEGYSAPPGGRAFTVGYYVGSKDASHWYCSITGWHYNPD
jgi:hypothetical protein